MGIFDKACPQCTADNAAGAIRCACGFIFDTADANGLGPSPQETAEEERLFQEYLAARVAKAIEQVTVAVHAADVEPANKRGAIEAIRLQAVVEKAKAELAAQQARAAKAAEAARAMEERKTNRDEFHAAQAEKIEQALSTARVTQSLKAGRECPLCTGPLAADATDCACGWTASAGEFKMPGLELSERERIETVGLPEAMTCPVECPVCTATVPAGVPNCGCGWAVPVGEREMPPLALSPDERSAIEDGEKIKRG